MTNLKNSTSGSPTTADNSDITPMSEFANCLFVIVASVAAGLVAWQVFGRDMLVCSLVITSFVLLGYIKAAPKSAPMDFGTAPFVSSWRWTLFLPLFAVAAVWIFMASLAPTVAIPVPEAVYSHAEALVRWVVVTSFMSVAIEEVFFRGALLRLLADRFNVGVALVGQASLFALVHGFVGSGIGGFRGILLFVMGCVLALLFIRTRSLYSCMVVHWLWNVGTVLIEAQYVALHSSVGLALAAHSIFSVATLFVMCVAVPVLLWFQLRGRQLGPWLKGRELWRG
jgi:membrane protease YdiL (CAAX protease family)